MTHETRLGGQTVEGTPDEIGCAIGRLVVTPAAQQVARCHGADEVAFFYTGLVTHVLCSIAIVFDADTARRIAAVAIDQIDAAAAAAAAVPAADRAEIH